MNGSGFDSYVIYVIDQLLCLLHFFELSNLDRATYSWELYSTIINVL
jgi:hypothetical protein